MNVHVRVFVWVPFYVTRSASVGAAREEALVLTAPVPRPLRLSIH